MSFESSPYSNDEALSKIRLGTTLSPGVVTLSGHDAPKNWDIKQATGYVGATTTLHGDNIRQFEASFYLVADEWGDGPDDFEAWDAFRKIIDSCVNGPKPKALPIYHPDLAEQGITEVTSGGVMGAVHDGKGGKTIKVKFLQYKPKKKKKAAPPAGAAPKTEAPDPNAAAKAQLAALLAEAQKP